MASYHEKALKLFSETGQKQKEIQTLKNLADIHMQQGKLDQAENELKNVIYKYQAIGYKNLTSTYDLLANVNYRKGDQSKELLYRLKVLDMLYATHSDAPDKYWTYISLAQLYNILGQFDKALFWVKKTVSSGESTVSSTVYCSAIQFGVNSLVSQNKLNETWVFLKKYAGRARKSPDAGIFLNLAYGHYYEARKRFDIAENYYKKSLIAYDQFDKLHERKYLYAQEMYAVGHFYVTIGSFEKASRYLHAIEAYRSEIIPPVQQGKIQFELFKIDSASGHFITAIRHFELHKRITDSLFTASKVRQLNELQVKYEANQKEQQIRSLNSQALAQQAKLDKANIQRNSTMAGIMVVIVISLILYYNYRIKQKNNKIIIRKNETISQKNEQLQHLLIEKDWLLKEVHHRVKNNLHTIICLMESQAAYLENDALKAMEIIQQRIYTISLIHQKLYQSEDIKTIDMQSYIAEFVAYLADVWVSNRHIKFCLDIAPMRLSTVQAIPIALIINEAVTNSIKYAFPKTVSGEIMISMKQNGKQVSLFVADNGIGINISPSDKKTSSLGMILMKGLSEDINAQLIIRNEGGTKISVLFQSDIIQNELEPIPLF
ncbi:tetratricopeptide repeat-containing sensor histidine kinase [Mucilaginibacter celer]|uniref:histidine kinase n=1 Tax=Mucilaginibacter celer TaxID=2305508 RepID=A0A494VU28_9SPHI|nr:sensor histidine kinase [Mucilaginibacter celer]AYL97591.1 sensor histidine kinase [Mucilaginibacter celer]